MLAVVGVILTIIGFVKLKHDNDFHAYDVDALTVIAAFSCVGGIVLFIFGILPYLKYFPCITIIP
jgi:hypothetical protein